MSKQNRKIDIYLKHFRDKRFYYECSTTWSKTLKEAKRVFCAQHGLDPSQVKVVFSPNP